MRTIRSPQLSVLLPCRDAAEFVPLAIRSLEKQTLREFRVVAVNDGSDDETGDILERWAKRDDRVRVLHLDRVGLEAALEAGSEACEGRLLARIDADDVAHPRRFAEQVEFLAAQPEVTALGTHIRYFPHGDVGLGARRYQRWLNGLADPDRLARDIYVECPIAHPTLMVRRSAFEEVGGYRSNGWPEDYDLLLRLHIAGARLANIPRVLHFWREGNHRASRSNGRYSAEAFRACKINYLRQTVLENRKSVAVWGAGRVGKDFARSLRDSGIKVERFYDIDPRKIGQQVYGASVADAREVGPDLETYLLVAVGSPGARELIREELDRLGLREPKDYRCVA